MKGYWIYLFVCFGLCLWLGSRLWSYEIKWGNEIIYVEHDDVILQKLDKTIEQVLGESKIDQYRWRRFPGLSSKGLTYKMQGGIQFFDLKLISVEEVEPLYIKMYADLLSKMNALRVIRPFLADFPLNPETLNLIIGFKDSQGEPLPPPCIAVAKLEFGKFVLYEYRPRPGEGPYKEIYSKNMEDISALQDLFTPKMPKVLEPYKREVPVFSQVPSRCNSKAGREVFKFAKEFCRKHQLDFVIQGTVGNNNYDSCPFSFALRGSQLLGLSDSKELALTCGKELLSFVQTNANILTVMKHRAKMFGEEDPATVPEPRHMGFRISFWDENFDRRKQPYIAEIRFMHEKFSYFIADEYQRLVLLHEDLWNEDN